MLKELTGDPSGSDKGKVPHVEAGNTDRTCTVVNRLAVWKIEAPQMGVSQESKRTTVAKQ